MIQTLEIVLERVKTSKKLSRYVLGNIVLDGLFFKFSIFGLTIFLHQFNHIIFVTDNIGATKLV